MLDLGDWTVHRWYQNTTARRRNPAKAKSIHDLCPFDAEIHFPYSIELFVTNLIICYQKYNVGFEEIGVRG